MEFDCDNCKRMRTGDCAGLIRSCQGFVPLQRVDPEILKAAQEAHDNRMHKENYYGSRNAQKRAEAVEKARNERSQLEQKAAQEAHDNRAHKENYYGSRNAYMSAEDVEKARSERNHHKQRAKQEPVRPVIVQEDAAAALRAWRRAQAQTENIPAYCVFPDTTLNALAAAEIRTKANLLTVRGIGTKLYEKYGDALFKILSAYSRSESKEMTEHDYSQHNYSEQDYADALKHTLRNKDEIQKSKMCACFYCKMVFSSDKADWFDSNDSTHCPYCDFTTIIGDASGYPITDRAFMAEVKRSAYRR